MLFTTPLAVSVFLLGAASGSLLVSLRYVALRNRIQAEATEDLRRALFRKRREEPFATCGGVRAADFDCYAATAEEIDDRVGQP